MAERIQTPTFFADTSRIDEIRKMMELGIFTGITTNISIIAKESPSGNPLYHYKDLAQEFPNVPVSIQLLNEPTRDLIERGRRFAEIAPNMVVKVPMFGDGRGVIAAATLLREGIKVNVTALMSADQLLTLLMGPDDPTYLSLFYNRIKDGGGDPLKEISETRNLLEKLGSPSQIIVGSIRKPQDIREAVVAGAHIVTVTPSVFWTAIKHPQTERFIEQNQKDWEGIVNPPSVFLISENNSH